jgi:hypothetical protein
LSPMPSCQWNLQTSPCVGTYVWINHGNMSKTIVLSGVDLIQMVHSPACLYAHSRLASSANFWSGSLEFGFNVLPCRSDLTDPCFRNPVLISKSEPQKVQCCPIFMHRLHHSTQFTHPGSCSITVLEQAIQLSSTFYTWPTWVELPRHRSDHHRTSWR